jgi:hypothetical protein
LGEDDRALNHRLGRPPRYAAAMDLVIAHTWDARPAEPAERTIVRLSAAGDDLRVDIDAPDHGDPPPPGAPGPTWALWDHEVVELFVLGKDDRYTEIEIGPHGHHLVLQLHGRRKLVARELPLRVEVRRDGRRWTATALLSRSLLPSGPHRINAYAIHGVAEGRRYLAWAPVPGPAPDFHRLEHFVPATLP